MIKRITIETNIPRVRGRYIKRRKRFKNSTGDVAKEIANFIKRSAKQLAPKGRTGKLRAGIDYKSKAKATYVVGVYGAANRYGRYVERGQAPGWIPREYLRLHNRNPGAKGHRLPKEEVMRTGGYVFVRPSSKSGFLSKAMSRAKGNVPKLAKRVFKRNKVT